MSNLLIWACGAIVSGLLALFLMFSKKISIASIMSFFTNPSTEAETELSEKQVVEQAF